MVRSSRSTAGTVEQAAMPETGMSASSPRNVSASSSAVVRASDLIRQECIIVSPSKTPMTVLVLPTSIARSMAALDVQPDVENRRRVRQRAHCKVVDAGPGDGAGVLEPQSAGRLQLGPLAGVLHRRAHVVEAHVVEQDEVGPGVHHGSRLFERVDLDLE